MKKREGFTLIELLIVVAIIAALVGAALPYYQNYVKETKIAKAKYELDIVKEALVKFDTFEDKKFSGTDLTALMGKYLQALNVDPWGRGYIVEVASGQLRSLGPDPIDAKDDIVVDYKPSLALLSAKWIDVDRNQHVSHLDLIQLEFTRYLIPGLIPTFGNNPSALGFDLLLSSEVKYGAGFGLVASTTLASSTETYLWVDLGGVGVIDDTVFYPGSSTIKVASGNVNLRDFSGRKANGSVGEYKALEVTIKPN